MNKETNLLFIKACEKGDLERVKSFLIPSILQESADIHFENDLGLRHAARRGYLDIVEFLLTDPSLKKHSNIKVLDFSPLRNAAENGQLEVVKFLLTSEKLQYHANVNYIFEEECSQNVWTWIKEYKEIKKELLLMSKKINTQAKSKNKLSIL